MVIGEYGDHGAHVTQEQAENIDHDLAIIQQPKMEVLHVQGHHQHMQIVCYIYRVFQGFWTKE